MILLITDYIKHLYLKYTHKRVDYDFYLTTKHWKFTRLKAIKRANYKCSLCGSRRYTLEVHHNSYYDEKLNNILYWEKQSDLICLCSRCHSVYHKIIYIPKSKREVS